MPGFFSVKDIHDVITHAKFGDDRLRGLGVVAGQISAFPIDFAGRPYNTLTLSCERVICSLIDVCFSIFSSIIPSHCIVFFSFVVCIKGADVAFIY